MTSFSITKAVLKKERIGNYNLATEYHQEAKCTKAAIDLSESQVGLASTGTKRGLMGRAFECLESP